MKKFIDEEEDHYLGPHCPYCGSNYDIYRIGLYDFRCGHCNEFFDISECCQADKDHFDDPDDYSDEDEDEDYKD